MKNYHYEIEKAESGGIRNGFDENLNQITASDSRAFSVSDYATETLLLQDEILSIVSVRPKIHRCFKCQNCGKPRTARKMSRLVGICRDCMQEAREKGQIAQSNFINRAVNNFLKSLKSEVQNAQI